MQEVRVALLGTPGRLMTWMSLLLRALIQESTNDDFETVVLDSDQGTTDFLTGIPSRNLMIVSHFPRLGLVRFLANERIFTLVVLDDCVSVLTEAINVGGQRYQEAIRPLTESLSRLARSRQLPLRSVVTIGHGSVPVGDFADRLSALISGPIPSDLHNRLARYNFNCRLQIGKAIEAMLGPSLPADRLLDDRDKTLIREVCDPLVDIVLGNDDVEIRWDVSFFYDGDKFSLPAPLSLDLVGPARCLYYGPYLHLPEGSYSGVLVLGLSSEIRDTLLRVEVFTNKLDAEFIARARTGGLYSLPIEFDVTDSYQAVQLRIFIDRGEIEGRLGFATTQLTPLKLACSS